MASNIKRVLLVMSGKGGVGKSSVTVQLAKALLESTDLRVGVLDIDLCGPSIPRMLGLEQAVVHQCDQGWTPVYVGSDQRLAVMSIGFLLGSRNDAVIWRGPKKTAMIRQFIEDVVWPELDILLVDTPPGTSDEHMAIVEVLKKWRSSPAIASTSTSAASAEIASNPTVSSECAASSDAISSSADDVEMVSSSVAAGAAGGGDGAAAPPAAGDCRQMACSALLVTTPQNVSVTDVRRQLAFCRKAALSVLGVLENMSGYVCPHCSECTNIFSSGGGEELCRVADVPFLGRLPLAPSISHALDAGSTISYTPETQTALNSVVTQLTAALA